MVKISIDNCFNEETKVFLSNHCCLSKQIISDIEKWQNSSARDARRASIVHFSEEAELVEGVKTGEIFTELSSLGTTRKRYEGLVSVTENIDEAVNLKFFEKRAATLLQDKRAKRFYSDAEALHYSLSKSLSESLDKRQTAYEQKIIDKSRQLFLAELYKQIDQFKQLENALQPIMGFFDTGTLWDMSSSAFSNYGFDVLRYYSETIKNNETIAELATLLGRQNVSSREVE